MKNCKYNLHQIQVKARQATVASAMQKDTKLIDLVTPIIRDGKLVEINWSTITYKRFCKAIKKAGKNVSSMYLATKSEKKRTRKLPSKPVKK